jgi:predicted PurR-regulated permease PerM
MVPNFSVPRGLAVLILFIIIQWLENNLLVPQVMKKKVGISPVVTIISMLIGVRIFGIIGIIIAVPLAVALSIFLKEFGRKQTSAEKTEK